jgi:hypothetical protein
MTWFTKALNLFDGLIMRCPEIKMAFIRHRCTRKELTLRSTAFYIATCFNSYFLVYINIKRSLRAIYFCTWKISDIQETFYSVKWFQIYNFLFLWTSETTFLTSILRSVSMSQYCAGGRSYTSDTKLVIIQISVR